MKRVVLSTTMLVMLGLAFAPGAHADKKKISPNTVSGAKTVNAQQAKKLFDQGVVFVDVRSDKDFAAGRIPDAIHIELKKVYSKNTLSEHVKPGQKVVIYCNGHSCLRSAKASEQAVSWGYKNVYYFRDGYPAWKKSGYPVE
ncbi:MAG: rhodanese-like domain-containing protein [Gammaproteobacteria bacterium]|nr:rhodanese-like domain-containing protein [Gammaproteobacteria bacterium]MDH5652417.1 rhodanese-like domain-containing protein [Gammaproteobacteria bacterium]